MAQPVPSGGRETIGQTLKSRAGPLPIWTWAAIGVVVLVLFLMYRSKKQKAAVSQQQTGTQSTPGQASGSTPVSYLYTQDQAMPLPTGSYYDSSQGTIYVPSGQNNLQTTTGVPGISYTQPGAASMQPGNPPAPPAAPSNIPSSSAGQTPGTGTSG